MKTFLFKLETKSYLLAASGEGSALIDADVVYHKSGFPFIPARRIKGLLKESMEEVLEIQGENSSKITVILNRYFGVEGAEDVKGYIRFKNLFPIDWENIKKHYKYTTGSFVFDPAFIKKCYTAEIMQTAIGDDGIAADRSLRNYRLIKPCKIFGATFECDDTTEGFDRTLLNKAVKNLRYAGTRRNRGFGKIACSIGEFVASKNASVAQTSGAVKAIKVALTTLSPVILAQQAGEQNTVSTAKNISGNHLRGILIKDYFQNKTTSGSFKHDAFFEMFLSGKAQFAALTFGGSEPFPLNIHEYKGYKTKPLIDVFTKKNASGEDKDLVTRAIGGFGKTDTNSMKKCKPNESFFFHNTRKNRALGRNTQDVDEGGIFYYEALDEDQEFTGKITGDEKVLKEIIESFPASFKTSLGKSRSAQYGDVIIALEAETEQTNNKTESSDLFLITCLTPLVLLNKNGMPEPTAESLKDNLKSVLAVQNLSIENASAAHTFVEQYNSLWAARSGKMPAYKEGSTFLLRMDTVQLPVEFSLGIMQEQGFGRMRARVYKDDGKFSSFNIFKKEMQGNKPSEEEKKNKPEEMKAIPVLMEIQAELEKQGKKIKIQAQAIHESKKLHEENGKKLKGHLISRLEMMLKNATDENYVNNWFKDMNKPAQDALKAAELIEEDGNFSFRKDTPYTFEGSKLYWITFLQTLRKLKKHD